METKTQANTFVEEISAIPGGEGIRLCIQCGTCTASCPNGAITSRHFTTEQIMAEIEGMLS